MRIVVVGAGLSGITAANSLIAGGHDVTLFDKGRSPGGRMATRRIGSATLDHGAQFFTIRSDSFAELVRPHLDSGLVYEWCRGFDNPADGYPRYAVRGGMNALAKALAAGLDVRCSSLVFAIRRDRSAPGHTRWSVALDDGTSVVADAVIVTCPTPQAFSLLVPAEVALPTSLTSTDYDRTIAVLLVLDRASAVPDPGGRQHPTDTLSFVTDNERKGISATPALTVHANAAWSDSHWGDDAETVTAALCAEAAPFIGDATVIESQVKKWRFATPRTIWPDPCWIAPGESNPLVVGGDAFAGPKIEGAALSGLAAALALTAS